MVRGAVAWNRQQSPDGHVELSLRFSPAGTRKGGSFPVARSSEPARNFPGTMSTSTSGPDLSVFSDSALQSKTSKATEEGGRGATGGNMAAAQQTPTITAQSMMHGHMTALLGAHGELGTLQACNPGEPIGGNPGFMKQLFLPRTAALQGPFSLGEMVW